MSQNTLISSFHWNTTTNGNNSWAFSENSSLTTNRNNNWTISENSSLTTNGNNTWPVSENSAWTTNGNNSWPISENSVWTTNGNNSWTICENSTWITNGNNSWAISENCTWTTNGNNSCTLSENSTWTTNGNNSWTIGENSTWTTNRNNSWTISENSAWTANENNWPANEYSLTTLSVFRNVEEVGQTGIIITFLRILVCCLLVFNSILLHTIISNKDKPWAKQTKQIRYLIVCDIVAAFFLWSVLLRFKNIWLCAITIFLSGSSQVVSSYHMLSVCIHRFRKLRRIDLPSGNNDTYRYGAESLFIWVAVFLLSAPPFLVSAGNEDLPVCRSDVLFRSEKVITSIYRLILSCLPCFLTNVLYGILLWKMRVRLNVIQPTNQVVQFRNTQNANTSESQGQVTIQPTSQNQTAVTTRKLNKVNKIIGYLLLVLNISVLAPIISNALILAGYEGVSILMIQTLTYVNNIFNPFIYSVSIGPLRKELVSTFRALFSRVTALITCTNAQN